MRRVQILSIIVFVLAAGFFCFYRFWNSGMSDSNAPVIAMDAGSIEVSCDASDEELLAGVTASDKKDGDVTDSLMIESLSDFTDTGKRTMTVVAFDSDNNVASATREVVYTDYQAPRFSLEAPFRFPVGNTDVLEGLTAYDTLDGDLTDRITITCVDDVYMYVAGTYAVVFSVTNSAGDTVELPVNIEFYDSSGESAYPQITLSEYLIYTEEGESVNAWDYVESITLNRVEYVRDSGGSLVPEDADDARAVSAITSDNVTISEDTSYITSGVYEILYEITDEDGRTGSVRLIVVTG